MDRPKLKILILSPIAPYPPHDGWAVSIYNVVKGLGELGHEITFLGITDFDEPDLEHMRSIGHTEYFYRQKPPRWWQVVTNLGRPEPFSITRYIDDRMVARAVELIRERAIDVVLLEDLAMAPYAALVADRCGIPYFIRTHNIDTQLYQRHLEQQRNPIMRAVTSWQTAKMARYEADALRRAPGYSVLSPADAETLRSFAPDLDPDVVENGSDLDRFDFWDGEREPELLVHIGALIELTKTEAMDWFCREVMPRVRAQRPGVRLQLVGTSPEGAFDRYDGVEQLGRVEDERPYLRKAGVFVAPQFVGGGVRLTVLNAMATGNAIACTSVSAEGMGIVDGEHALVRDDPEELAEAVLTLLADDGLSRRLGQNARKLVESRFSWKAIVPKQEKLLYDLVERR